MSIRQLALSLLLLFVSAQSVVGQRVQVYSSKDSVRIGEPFTLVVRAEHSTTSRPVFPEMEPGISGIGDLEILLIEREGRREVNGVRVDSLVLRVAAFSVDSARVSPVTVLFSTGADTLRAASAPFFLPVISTVPPEAASIEDIAPIVDFPRAVWPWILAALAALFALAVLWYLYNRLWKNRYRPREDKGQVVHANRSPYDEAMARLAELERWPLTEHEQMKPYFVELTEAMRTYLSRTTGIHALELTSRELMDRLRVARLHPPLEPAIFESIEDVLELADLAKYADANPDRSEARAALVETRRCLEAIEASRRRARQQSDDVEKHVAANA